MNKVFILILTVVIMAICLVGCEESNGTDLKQEDTNSIYIWIDEKTGVHYVIYHESLGYSGGAGITPRLNADGTLYITTECEHRGGNYCEICGEKMDGGAE